MIDLLVRSINFSGIGVKLRKLRSKLYKNRIIFVHVPKSGGTSLAHLLRVRYMFSYTKVSEESSSYACRDLSLGKWFDFKRRQALYYVDAEVGFIQGHVTVDGQFIDSVPKEYKFITLLRNPIERVISHYYFDTRLASSGLTVKKFLSSKRALNETHVLCHFFGGLDWDGDFNRDSVVVAQKRAVQTLSRFAVVGILEDDDGFRKQCSKVLNVRLKMPRRNIGLKKTACDCGEFEFDEVDRLLLEKMCEADIDIYKKFAELS